MVAGAIDIGTNTTLALLAETDKGGMKLLRDQTTMNRLGEGLGTNGTIPAEIISLNVDLLQGILRDFRRAGAEGFALAGTSALRRAKNRQDFISAVREVVGLQVEVIGGREEAALTYLGALSGREIFPGERACVMDLGGGSTEIVEGRGFVPGQGYSIDVGAVFLANQFFHNDPPSVNEVSEMRADLRKRLPQLVNGLRDSGVPWVLVGGTVVTLAILKSGLRRYDPETVGGMILNADDVDQQILSFTGKTATELQNLPGMPSGRGRTILAGAILLREMFDALGIAEGTVSERGLRHGLWLAHFGERSKV